MQEMMNQLNEQMTILPQWVQYWMNWMMLIFALSILFVWKQKFPRYVLISFILTMPVGLMVFYLTRNAHLLGIAHFILWAPLLFGLIKFEVRRHDFTFKSIYGLWVSLLMATITISLLFDIRDIVLVALGAK